MVSRSVGWWLVSAAVLLGTTSARAQSSASFPEEPKQAALPQRRHPRRPHLLPQLPSRRRPLPQSLRRRPRSPLIRSAARRRPNRQPAPFTDLRFPVAAGRTATASPDAPPLLPYREGMPVPSGYTLVDRPATGLITAGVIGLGISYATGVIIAASQGFDNGTALLALPIIGPYAAIGTREYACEVNTVAAAKKCTADETQIVTLMAVDGLAQTAGALVAVAGLMSGTKELVRSDLPEVSVTPPVSARSGWQFSVRGDF